MASKLWNRAGVSTTTATTGTITLGAAIASGTAINSCSFLTFANAGVTDGITVRYLILDGNGAWEYGTGVYTSAGTTLSRTLGASSTGSLLTLSGSSQVFITAIAADIAELDTEGKLTLTRDTSSTNIVSHGLRVGTTSSGTPADNIGTGIEFLVETASNNNEIGATMEVIARDTTSTSEDFNIVFKSMAAGATATEIASFRWHSAIAGVPIMYLAGVPVFSLDSAAHNYVTFNDPDGNLAIACGATADPANYYNNTRHRFRSSGGGTLFMYIDSTGTSVGLTAAPDRLFHVEQDNSATNTVTYLGRFTSTSSGTPALGLGVGIEFEVETSAGVNKVLATSETVVTNVGGGTEAGDLVFKTMSAGAAATEKGRTGFMPSSMTLSDNITLVAGYSLVINSSYTIPTGLLLTLGSGAVMRIL